MLLNAYADGGGTVLHTDGNFTRVFASANDDSAVPELPVLLSSADLRTLLSQAGVHCWLETDDVLYAGCGFVAIHATVTGEKQIHLPAGYKCIPLRPDGDGTSAQPSCRFTMNAHETRIFRIV